MFPYFKTIDDFDFNRLEHVSRACVWELASCDFIKNRQNIVMIGNSGSGKTPLSLGLGLKACNAGFNVKFYTAANLVNELSYLTFNRHQSELLFQVISERSERGSVIVTTNNSLRSYLVAP